MTLPESKPRKAYYVVEAHKGTALWLVYANTAREARERFHSNGEHIDSQSHPNGVRSVRRAPEEDES